VDALVLRALAKRPEDRYASMDEFAAEIAVLRAELTGSADAPRGAATTDRFERRGRASWPRGETVALPEGSTPVRLPTAPLPTPSPAPTPQRSVVAAVAVAGAIAAAAAGGYLMRGEARTPERVPGSIGTAAASLGPTPGAAPAMMAATPDARIGSPVEEPVAAPAEIGVTPPRARPAPAPVRARSRPVHPAGDVKDPYGDGALKPDPFE
jgi:serine/threonine-protein kinase